MAAQTCQSLLFQLQMSRAPRLSQNSAARATNINSLMFSNYLSLFAAVSKYLTLTKLGLRMWNLVTVYRSLLFCLLATSITYHAGARLTAWGSYTYWHHVWGSPGIDCCSFSTWQTQSITYLKIIFICWRSRYLLFWGANWWPHQNWMRWNTDFHESF